MPKLKIKSAAQKRASQRKLKATQRSDPVTREVVQAANTESHRKTRSAPERREFEQTSNAQSHRMARRNMERRKHEQVLNTQSHRIARQNPERRKTEQTSNTKSRRMVRLNPKRRASEQLLDTQSHRITRQDKKRRITEQVANTAAHRKARLNTQRRETEKLSNTQSRQMTRKNPVRRQAERENESVCRTKRRKTNDSVYENLLQSYNENIRRAPSFICSSCGGLFYIESTSLITKEKLKALGCGEAFISSVLHVKQSQHRLCTTCKTYVSKKKIPRLCLSNGFDYPTIPEPLKDLSPLEERLVSLRLPFMQIRLLGSERQSVLRGNIVNVENDLDVVAQVLPRSFDETSTIQVQLKRQMRHRTPFMYETIRPLKVYQAAKYLINTDLYKSENVLLSEDWSMYDEDDSINFICSGNEQSIDEPDQWNDIIADIEHVSTEDENNVPAENENLGAEETLVFRENDTSYSGIIIAPGEGKTPIPLYSDPNAELLSFPTIYCGVDRKFKKNLKISYTDISKSEARRYDRRACKPYKILYQFKKSFNEKVYQAIQVCLRKMRGNTSLTAARIRTPGEIENILRADEGFAVFRNIRSSASYWKEKTKKVVAMVRQVGKCTLFITLSAAETKWTELLVILMKILKGIEITEEEAADLTFEEKSELIRSDPVTCMRHFDHRYRTLLNLLFKREGGIFAPYKFGDFFSRYEYQVRGSPHVHGMYWIPDAPSYVEDNDESEKSCIEFIDKFVTSERCEEGLMENLIGYQLHKHSRTCEKRLQKGVKCRFEFPKPPMEKTCILKPFPKDFDPQNKKQALHLFTKIQDKLNEYGRGFKEDIEYATFLNLLCTNHSDYINAIRSSIKRTTVFVKRSTNAIFVNQYNRKLLEAWGANIDVQFVLDTYACAKYCVGYILKSEGGISRLLQAATLDARKGNLTIGNKLKKYASILINGSEISAQEAASFILSIPNTVCSRQDVFINTAHPDERIGFLKSKEELDQLPADSEEIFVPGIISHYSKRHEEQENICLAEFASLYEYTKAKKISFERKNHDNVTETPRPRKCNNTWELVDNSDAVRRRIVQKVIRFRHYIKLEDEYNYYREQLMLFLPWRDESAELLSPTLNPKEKAERFAEQILRNRKPFYWCHDMDDEALIAIVNEIENETTTPMLETDLMSEENDDFNQHNIFQDSSSCSRTEHFLPPRLIEPKEYVHLMRTLNEKQRRIVLDVFHRMKTLQVPFHLFLSGGAGVGKSHVVTSIVQSYMKYSARIASINPEQVCVLVSAPTGKAAFNVFGMTLHCTFKLPPTQYGGKICNLDDSVLNTLRLKFSKTNLFIIDEISMVSVKQLYYIDQRLRQIFSTTEDFGGKSVIVVGHLRQLSPVAGTYIFKPPKHLPLGECVGNYLWEKFKFYELDEIMRQRGQLEFCNALNNMAEGSMDLQDINLIKAREIVDGNEPPKNAIRLFRTNEECQQYNKIVHATLKTEGAMSTAFDRIQGSGSDEQILRLLEEAKRLTPQQSDGLPYKTHLQVGGEYFVTTNIDVEDGLFNGSTGCLEIIEKRISVSNELIPVRVWMDFRNPLIGLKARKRLEGLIRLKNIPTNFVPIDRITKNLSKTGRHHGLQIFRKQIPLLAANGMTIAKSQGSSIPFVVVNVKPFNGRNLRREDLYVACSRSTSYEGLYIDGKFMPPSAPGPDDPVTCEMAKLRSNPHVFTIRFLQDYNDNYEKLYFHNVQSVVAHYNDFIADQCAMASNCIAFVEPHLFTSDELTVHNYNILHRSNCNAGIRNSEGAVILLKKHYSTSQRNVTISNFFQPGKNRHCFFVQWKLSGVNIIMGYKSPQYSNACFLTKLRQTLNKVNGLVLVIGDMNIDLHEATGKSLLNLMEESGLQSKINLEESSTNLGTNIDVCFSNVQHLQAWFYESYYSYHKPICMVWPIIL